jgi:hypothetical protein
MNSTIRSPYARPTVAGNLWLRPEARFYYLSTPRTPYADRKKATHLNREPSICRSKGGLVVHSATLRSTAFIADAREADRFAARFAACLTLAAKNRLADSLF